MRQHQYSIAPLSTLRSLGLEVPPEFCFLPYTFKPAIELALEAGGQRRVERLDAHGTVREVGRIRRRRNDPRRSPDAGVRVGQGLAADLPGAAHPLPLARRRRRPAAPLRVRAEARSEGQAGRGNAAHGAADASRSGRRRARAGGIRVRSEVARRRPAHARPHDGIPQVAGRREAVDSHRQSPGVVAGRVRAVDLRAADAGAHAALPQRALRGDGAAVSLAHAPAASPGADAGRRTRRSCRCRCW